jgi:hypothetical protein
MMATDYSQYICEKCGMKGICEAGMEIFIACLCQTCFDMIWKEYREMWKDYPQGWRESDMNPDQVSEFIDTRRDQS